jgi:hypothetical protein
MFFQEKCALGFDSPTPHYGILQVLYTKHPFMVLFDKISGFDDVMLLSQKKATNLIIPTRFPLKLFLTLCYF